MLLAHGSGTLNLNNNDIDKIFTEELLQRSIKTQRELIKKAIKILKVNGELIYSTCSILKKENEEIIQEILNSQNMEIIPIDEKMFEEIPQIPTKIQGSLCICPSNLYEGFFVVKLKKNK